MENNEEKENEYESESENNSKYESKDNQELYEEEEEMYIRLARKHYLSESENESENELKVIRPSKSPWASPVTLAKKKTGNYRFCVDYRKLNAVTITDAYPLPRIDELLERYRTAKWFTSLDLAAGFHQVEMAEEDKEKTAFICSKGLYEYNVMPFGLKNAPGTFQRLMDEILSEYIGEFVVVYIDDIMIYSKSFEEHMEHLEKFGRDGLKPEEKKIEKIRNMERPRNVKEIRLFLGLFSYYRKFVKDFQE
ncbi:retroviral-like aspartic protease 1 [Rhizophagus clarus]|uniref:Retroviral-like aspartic protease 1 n=1 Tax=Rhizophagus clarus TaxID=94130 RepID=A0A8H3LBN7_9GLOM|nr:retroviral-like aspartic protease 1 [Rhizophagus clarus]